MRIVISSCYTVIISSKFNHPRLLGPRAPRWQTWCWQPECDVPVPVQDFFICWWYLKKIGAGKKSWNQYRKKLVPKKVSVLVSYCHITVSSYHPLSTTTMAHLVLATSPLSTASISISIYQSYITLPLSPISSTWCWRHPPSRQQGGTSSRERWEVWALPLSSSDGHPGPSAENLQCNYCHPIIVNHHICHQHRQLQSWLVAMDDNLPGPYHPQDPNPGLSP